MEVRIAREIGDRDIVAVGLLNLTMLSIGRGSAQRARDMLSEVIVIAQETDSKPLGQCALDVSAGFGAWKEDWESAARFFGAAQAQVFATGVQRDPETGTITGYTYVDGRTGEPQTISRSDLQDSWAKQGNVAVSYGAPPSRNTASR